MGRPKGSKNSKTVKVAKPRAEKLNMTVVNQALKNLSDLAADWSFLFREQRQNISLERELLIKREADIMKMTEGLMKTHGRQIVEAAVVESKEQASVPASGSTAVDDPKPANLGELFGSKDPVSK